MKGLEYEAFQERISLRESAERNHVAEYFLRNLGYRIEYESNVRQQPAETTSRSSMGYKLVKIGNHTPKDITLRERFEKEFGSGLEALLLAHAVDGASLVGSILEFCESETRRARERRDGELIIMMDEVVDKGWTLNRFLGTFCALYEKNYGHRAEEDISNKQEQ